ncbi:hypothetical protein B0H16DRAFT_1834806 [Mycena metata]|uniref:Uncharacterized protein n=1 Tax=Mycena metata TaxID=1033252 RepID=A0AAD7J241_9AGAR|nr:hypothetical protein B0H16DRAFT_1834806 [Mycena metata]
MPVLDPSLFNLNLEPGIRSQSGCDSATAGLLTHARAAATANSKQYLQTMYTSAMQGVHDYMVHTTSNNDTLSPPDTHPFLPRSLPASLDCSTDAWVSQPKQEHLACFLAGSLMLGATSVHLADSSAPTSPGRGKSGSSGTGSKLRASSPPRMNELTATGQRDWETGVRFLEGCLGTLGTKTGLSPEGVHCRTPADPKPKEGERDWYIKGMSHARGASHPARAALARAQGAARVAPAAVRVYAFAIRATTAYQLYDSPRLLTVV